MVLRKTLISLKTDPVWIIHLCGAPRSLVLQQIVQFTRFSFLILKEQTFQLVTRNYSFLLKYTQLGCDIYVLLWFEFTGF